MPHSMQSIAEEFPDRKKTFVAVTGSSTPFNSVKSMKL